MSKTQALGILPTWSFWHGQTQAQRHVLALELALAIPLSIALSVLAFSVWGPGLLTITAASVLPSPLALGLIERHLRKEITRRRARYAALEQRVEAAESLTAPVE